MAATCLHNQCERLASSDRTLAVSCGLDSLVNPSNDWGAQTKSLRVICPKIAMTHHPIIRTQQHNSKPCLLRTKG